MTAAKAPETAPWWPAPLLILAAGLASYANSFGGPFVCDDLFNITLNETIRDWGGMKPLFPPSRFGYTVSGRPVLNLTLAVNHSLGGLDVWGYHAANVLIHLLGSLTLYALVRRTLALPSIPGWLGRRGGWVALAVGLLFAVHPLQTAAVTYTIQRAESLAAIFYLLTLLCVCLAGTSPHPWRWQVLAVLACLLGIGTKEVVASAPLVALAYDRAFLAGSWGEALRKRGWFYLALFLSWVPLGLLSAATGWRGGTTGLGELTTTAGVPSPVTPLSYFLEQPSWIVHYLRLSVAPWPLTFDYGEWPTPRGPAHWAAFAAVTGLGLAAAWAMARAPMPGVLGLLFFAVLAPTSSFIPVSTQIAAEHRMYLPLAAVLVGLAAAAAWWDERLQGKAGPTLLVVLACIAGLFAYLTHARNRDYASAMALWADTAAKAPKNPRGWMGVGDAHAEAGRHAEAARAYAEAVRLVPRSAVYLTYLAQSEEKAGLPADALRHFREALRYFREKERTGATAAGIWRTAGQALLRLGTPEEAAEALREAVRLAPWHYEPWLSLGVALRRCGRAREAEEAYRQAIELEPSDPRAYNNLASILRLAKEPARAADLLRQALKHAPADARTHTHLGDALSEAGDWEGAASAYRAALRIDATSQQARRGLATALGRLKGATP